MGDLGKTINELRMLICGWLLELVLKIVPDNEEGNRLVAYLGAWASESLEEFKKQSAGR